MINSPEEARALVAATKYPPVGERSWGPTRVMTLRGSEPQAHLEAGNRTSLVLAMIETSRALGALDDILAVPGIDGVFIGPSDLSVSFSEGGRVAPFDASLEDPIRRIADVANAAGKITGAFAASGARARTFREWGCRLIALGTDQMYLAAGAEAMLSAVRA
jgi:4-hydroxy-2-oxoheptanedioate aldolase